MSPQYEYTISYGKRAVPVYRVYATPLRVSPIPESPFTGRENILLALEVDVQVFGNNFLPAYTVGDNSNVVATDSMKNFMLRQSLEYNGATLEGLLDFLGRGFLATYPQIEHVQLSGRELPFATAQVPQASGFVASDLLFSRSHSDYGVAVLEYARDGAAVQLLSHSSGRAGMQLLKVSGSAFTRFVRDEFTTLPERVDRPLFIYVDMFWKYADPTVLLNDPAQYVASEQVRDLAATVFHEFVSESIQHLVHEIGVRLLDRFPQLAEVEFVSQNRTRDPVAQSESDERQKVYSDPFPAYGEIRLVMRRGA